MKTLRMYQSVEIDGAPTQAFVVGGDQLGGRTESIEQTPLGIEVKQSRGKETRTLTVTPMGVCVEEWAEFVDVNKDERAAYRRLGLEEPEPKLVPKPAKRRPGRPRKTHV